jgi:circadian clock protein KaiC
VLRRRIIVKSAQSFFVDSRAKAPTGIVGFDEIIDGGLTRGRTTLLAGRPVSGKTIFAMRFAVYGARYCKEPGIFVAFEETPNIPTTRRLSSAGSSSWLRPCAKTDWLGQ